MFKKNKDSSALMEIDNTKKTVSRKSEKKSSANIIVSNTKKIGKAKDKCTKTFHSGENFFVRNTGYLRDEKEDVLINAEKKTLLEIQKLKYKTKCLITNQQEIFKKNVNNEIKSLEAVIFEKEGSNKIKKTFNKHEKTLLINCLSQANCLAKQFGEDKKEKEKDIEMENKDEEELLKLCSNF